MYAANTKITLAVARDARARIARGQLQIDGHDRAGSAGALGWAL
jgi:hypothetical protein